MNKTAKPILYTFRRCPYAMRARMAICAAAIGVESIEVSLKNKPQSLLEYSPKGTVPVVVTTDNQVIEESRDIMLWALHQSDPDDWLMQHDITAQQQMTQLMDICDKEFKPLLDRYKYFERYPQQTQQEYRQQAEFFLGILEERLQKNYFLMDSKIHIADIAIFPFIRQFAATDQHWFTQSPYKYLQGWLDRCINSTLFETIMKK